MLTDKVFILAVFALVLLECTILSAKKLSEAEPGLDKAWSVALFITGIIIPAHAMYLLYRL